MVFKNLCVLVLCTEVASAFEGVNSFNAEATFVPGTRCKKIFEYSQNPVMLVFIGKPLLSSQMSTNNMPGLLLFSAFLHHIVLTKLATSSKRVHVHAHLEHLREAHISDRYMRHFC